MDDSDEDVEPDGEDRHRDRGGTDAIDTDAHSATSMDDDKADSVVDASAEKDTRRGSTSDSVRPPLLMNMSSINSFDSVSSGQSEDSPMHKRRPVKAERENTILTFEIYAKGDNKYCHRSMRNLFTYMLKTCQSHDVPEVPVLQLGDLGGSSSSVARYAARTSTLSPYQCH